VNIAYSGLWYIQIKKRRVLMLQKYTGKQIIRAGEDLINPDITEDNEKFSFAMDVLSFWRFSHEEALEIAFTKLQTIALQQDKNAIFAKRLKRHASIVFKLKRFSSMKLKNIQDIGGCRCIVTDQKKLIKIARDLKKCPEFRHLDSKRKLKYKEKDYIENPKEDGYRGYHLIGSFSDSDGNNKTIEIQLRTKLQHYWATALEIVDLFTGQALKSNQGDDRWKQFFFNVSEQFSVMEKIHLFGSMSREERYSNYVSSLNESQISIESCEAVKHCCRKLDVIKKFEAFAGSLKIIDDKIVQNPNSGYVLLQINTKKKSVSSMFFRKEDNKLAETEYISAEKESAKHNGTVVALVSTTAVGGIKEAYPNYFADSSEFLMYLIYITEANEPQTNWFLNMLFGKK
jgi:ppGpp synthetase/RelA/SpoT-type nucleotidyltranferase